MYKQNSTSPFEILIYRFANGSMPSLSETIDKGGIKYLSRMMSRDSQFFMFLTNSTPTDLYILKENQTTRKFETLQIISHPSMSSTSLFISDIDGSFGGFISDQTLYLYEWNQSLNEFEEKRNFVPRPGQNVKRTY